MKQRAVEWLIDKLKSQGLLIGEPDNLVAVNQAKEMEKQQIIDAHNHGFTEGTCFGASPISYKFIESEQYYNETFNTKNQ